MFSQLLYLPVASIKCFIEMVFSPVYEDKIIPKSAEYDSNNLIRKFVLLEQSEH